MPSSKDLAINSTPSILLVGDGGTEKTRFLAQCPKPFIFDFDNGVVSAREFEFDYETFKDAPFGSKAISKDLGIYPWGESWPRFIDYLNLKIWPKIEKGELPYLTLGFDSLTALANQCMNYVLKSTGKTGQAQPEIQHWGSQLRLLETVIEQLSAWPIRKIVTAHIKRDENLVSGEKKEYLPLVGGQLSGKIGIYFDECYFTDVSGTGKDRVVRFITETSPTHRQAKSRANVPNKTVAKWSVLEPYFGGGKNA